MVVTSPSVWGRPEAAKNGTDIAENAVCYRLNHALEHIRKSNGESTFNLSYAAWRVDIFSQHFLDSEDQN